MKYSLFVLLFTLLGCHFSIGQDTIYGYHPPLDIPLYLAGNFGELRTNHFHSGIDIKTQGREGLNVFAIEEGFVSRIRVSSYGYGQAVYIDHPDGRTSVYAHMSAFNQEITTFLRKAQYDLSSFEVDLYPNANALKVKKGEIIGLSGNTGSSGGPHVHFELRETSTELPLNPLQYGFKVEDQIKPSIFRLMVVPRAEDALVEGRNQKMEFRPSQSSGNGSVAQQIKAFGKIGFAINTIDQYTGMPNQCGVYQIQLFEGEELIYEMVMDTLDFSTSRHINAYKDFERFKSKKKNFHRSFILPNNRLNIYRKAEDQGEVNVENGETRTFKYIVRDLAGNTSSLQFIVQGDDTRFNYASISESSLKKTCETVHWEEDYLFQAEQCIVQIPAGRLYEDFLFCYEQGDTMKLAVAPLHTIGDPYAPLQNKIVVKIALEGLPDSLLEKAFVAKYDVNTKRWYNRGGNVRHGWISTKVKEFGSYTVRLDTLSPSIKNLSLNTSMKGRSQFAFRIADDLSGIDRWEARIDGKWALMQYEHKKNRLYYYFEDDHVPSGTHQFELTVWDERGNEKSYTLEFTN